MTSESLGPARYVYAYAAASALGAAVYGFLGRTPQPDADWLLWLVPLVAILVWVYRDAREFRIGAVHDWGLFLGMAWPILVPWYAFKTRGRAGWRLLLLLTACFLAPIIGVVTGALFGVEWHVILKILGAGA